ncbi:MAG TPA: alpha/beta hydrolase domain-containing protein [Acidimicrobiales bacterium]|nr:alpha/beta hydrolase domain-containing protein [Acidimicrobiales bacterium]
MTQSFESASSKVIAQITRTYDPVFDAREPHQLANPMHSECSISPPPQGYVWEQYVFEGSIGRHSFKTLLQIVRPIDPALASRVAVLEPWHRAGYWTLYSKVQRYLAREHHIAAVVVANPKVLESFIKPANPGRFDDLFLPELENTDSEVMAQAGALIKSGALQGVSPRTVVLGGQSTEGYWVRRYIQQEHGRASFRGGSVFDGYYPAQSALSSPRGMISDLDVPVVEVQGESELVRSIAKPGSGADYRRDDAELYRLYEVPGMPHVCTRRGASAERLLTMQCECSNWSDFPLFEIHHVCLDNLIAWVDRAIPATTAPRIETRDNDRVIVRDEHGNARGGLRTSYFEVPTATIHATCGPTPEDFSGDRCDFLAWEEPFDNTTLTSLYSTHAEYVTRVNRVLDELVARRWYLETDARDLREEAVGFDWEQRTR